MKEISMSINSNNYKSINKILNIKHRPKRIRKKKHKNDWSKGMNNWIANFMFFL